MAYGTIKVDTITFTDAGVDKSVTISGLVQNPTFSGNITVTGTVSGNTIQGQTVSGATITGGAAAFTTVTGGVATITSGVFALGSASNPSISFTGDANSGLYSPGSDQVAISTSGVGRLLVDSSGNLIQYSETTLERQHRQQAASAYTATNIKSVIDGATGYLTFETGSNWTNGNAVERLRITSAGLVGVGTSAPSNNCEIYVGTPSNNDAGITLTNGNNVGFGTSLSFSHRTTSGGAIATRSQISSEGGSGNSFLRFATTIGGTLAERVRIDEAGRVGVGTTSPQYKLHVSQTGSAVCFGESGSVATVIGTNAAGTASQELSLRGFPLTFTGNGGGGSEAARIDSSGRLLVGTSTARSNFYNTSATANIQIETAAADAALSVVGNSTAGFAPAVILGLSNSNSLSSNALVANGQELGRLVFQGNDGNEFVQAAQIQAFVDGTPSANDMPSRLVFSVTADGASSPTEAMRIKNSRIINFANAPTYADNAAATTGGLAVGDVYRTSTGQLMIRY